MKLFTCSWIPKDCEPKALIFLCHGYAMECSISMKGNNFYIKSRIYLKSSLYLRDKRTIVYTPSFSDSRLYGVYCYCYCCIYRSAVYQK